MHVAVGHRIGLARHARFVEVLDVVDAAVVYPALLRVPEHRELVRRVTRSDLPAPSNARTEYTFLANSCTA